MDKGPLQVMRACRLGLGGIVQLWCRGEGLNESLSRLIFTTGGKAISPAVTGKIQHGILRDPESGGDDIDEILLAWTDWGAEINCHGGSTCATAALRLLAANGFKEISLQDWWLQNAQGGKISLCQFEANLRLPNAVTPRQVRLLSDISKWEFALHELINNLCEENIPLSKALLEQGISAYKANEIILKKHLVAVVGAPNVGKSTCFNAMLELDRAMVSATAGTTRDAVRQAMVISDLSIELVDTAGLLVEAKGADAEAVARAREIMKTAELCLLILDGSRKFTAEDLDAWQTCKGTPTLVIINKNDLPQLLDAAECCKAGIKNIDLRLSALEDMGVERLAEEVAAKLWGETATAAITPLENSYCGAFTARQHQRLTAAQACLESGDLNKAKANLQKIINAEGNELKSEINIISAGTC